MSYVNGDRPQGRKGQQSRPVRHDTRSATAFEQTLHSACHSRVSVLVRAHCVLLTHLNE